MPGDPKKETDLEKSGRRSQRFPVFVPVKVTWQGSGGTSITEEARAEEVNLHGGILFLKTPPLLGSEVQLTNYFSGETAAARVVAARRSVEGKGLGVAVELLVPSETFWGVTFRLKKTTSELLKLERAMQSGEIDLRALREFRDAVDYVRKTAWVVHEWRERQASGRDTETVISMLKLERIRRATQLNNDLTSDLNTHEMTQQTPGLPDLLAAVGRLFQRLTALLKNQKETPSPARPARS